MIIFEKERRRAAKTVGDEKAIPQQSAYPGFRPKMKEGDF